jgi:flagellin
MTELATQSSNGIYGDTERQALNAEFQQLKSELDRISQATNFNGKNVLDGSLSQDGLDLQIGDTADLYNILSVSVNSMSSAGLGLADISIDTLKGAQTALGTVAQQGQTGTIKGAINYVSEQRASLGATQNRLEHTISSLWTTKENITAAESRIRDTDMAKEIMNYTKNNILLQASQAMLAQANMAPQSVISLLR